MAMFPKIDSPCPYKSKLASVMDGDMCRMCNRQVFDLTEMRDEDRVAFMAGCTADEVCVSYRIPLRPAVAAAAMAVSLLAPMAAAAQEQEIDIVVGGVRAPAHARFVTVAASHAQVLPVVYEDEGGNTKIAADAPKADPAISAEPGPTPLKVVRAAP